MSAIFPAEVGC